MWDQVHNIKFGEILYEITVTTESSRMSVTSEHTYATVDWSLPPYSIIKVSIRAVTNWGVGPRVSVALHTPPSLPGPPHNLRTFVTKLEVSCRNFFLLHLLYNLFHC